RDAELRARRGQQPLPVADVRRQQNDRAPLASEALDQIAVLDRDALRELVRARAVAPERLGERLAQIDERLPQQLRALLVRLLGKRIGKVPRGEVAMPAQHVERDEVREMAECVKHRQRQSREKLEDVTHGMNTPAWERARGA